MDAQPELHNNTSPPTLVTQPMGRDIEPISLYIVWVDFRKGTVCTNTKLSVCSVLLNQLPLAFCYALLAAFIFEIHCTSEKNGWFIFPPWQQLGPWNQQGRHIPQCGMQHYVEHWWQFHKNIFITNTNLELTHVYLCILACTCVFLCMLMYILMCTHLYWCILVYTRVYLVYSCILVYTHTYLVY